MYQEQGDFLYPLQHMISDSNRQGKIQVLVFEVKQRKSLLQKKSQIVQLQLMYFFLSIFFRFSTTLLLLLLLLLCV